MNAIQVYSGQEVLALLASSDFQHAWEQVYQECPWATGFQSPVYISTWYRVYYSEFKPILLAAYSLPGSLHGLLALALTLDGRYLFAAAGRQAEYQVWIALPAYGDLFMPQALRALQDYFPKLGLQLKYMPPGTPLAWWHDKQNDNRRCSLTSVRDPIWEQGCIRDDSNKRLRTKLNGLKRLGEVKFSRPCKLQEFAVLLEQFIPLFDFRQGAAHQKMPFRSNVRKQHFFMELFAAQPNLLHVSVLSLNQALIGALIGVTGHGVVHLGEIVYSPFFSKYSPGNLHLWLLIQHLEKEGTLIFDLTPGGDAYKERFCSSVRTAYVLDVYRNYGKRMMQLANLRIKQRISDVTRYLPDKVRCLALPPYKSYQDALTAARRRLADWQLYQRPLTAADRAVSASVAPHNNIADILRYQPESGGEKAYYAFLSSCLDRVLRGGQCYTRVTDGVLAEVGWFFPLQEDGVLRLEWEPAPPNLQFMPQMLAIAAQTGAHSVCLELNRYQVVLKQSLIQAGFFPLERGKESRK